MEHFLAAPIVLTYYMNMISFTLQLFNILHDSDFLHSHINIKKGKKKCQNSRHIKMCPRYGRYIEK